MFGGGFAGGYGGTCNGLTRFSGAIPPGSTPPRALQVCSMVICRRFATCIGGRPRQPSTNARALSNRKRGDQSLDRPARLFRTAAPAYASRFSRIRAAFPLSRRR
jgi:hypothetical protein